MVRRWSCLIDINNNFENYKFFKKNHKINLFKNVVNFKKYSFKVTKFKRKALIRLKHQTTWLIYTNIIKLWVKDYKFNKNYLRYQFLNKIFLNNFFFYNFNFIKNRNENFFYNFNFIFFTFTNKNYSYFNKNIPVFVKNSPLTIAWFNESFSFNNSIIPLYSSWENNFYSTVNPQNNFFDFTELFDVFFSLVLKKNIEIRKILILFFYYNISKNQNLKS